MKLSSLFFLLLFFLLIACDISKDKSDYQEIESMATVQGEGYLGDES